MPKRRDIKKVMVIGSGPIIIGQAAEFDYAGTQACRALKEEGIGVVLANSNPATIMTDTNISDKVYIEPLNIETIMKIIIKEKPDSLLPTLGGQTGLNLAMELYESGFLKEHNVSMLGTKPATIKTAEDRQSFKEAMERIGEPCTASKVVTNVGDALEFAGLIRYPVVVRPAYTLGGTGGGIADNETRLREIAASGLRLSRVGQVLIEKCISGWKEIEFEVMRDSRGNVITVCDMENVDPVGVHTGDSIVAAPCQTLSEKEYKMLKSAAVRIITELGVEGGCNIQFALHPSGTEYNVIEVNPRVSRSSALASKATGFPIARVATKIAIGYSLDEMKDPATGKPYSGYEPHPDYVVVKIPKWPFDKFVKAEMTLGTQMKATGEVMAIGTSFESALMKAIRSLELGLFTLDQPAYKKLDTETIIQKLHEVNDERIFLLSEALRRGVPEEDIYGITKIDKFFISRIKNIVSMEEKLKSIKGGHISAELIHEAKKLGFTDGTIASLSGCDRQGIKLLREKNGIKPVFKTVDILASGSKTASPYYYSTWDGKSEYRDSHGKKVLVIGSGPIRIGQGIEFDYCSVHSVWALQEEGYEAIIANNNPETVSTDFDTSDRLYFEPLTEEDIENIVETEKPAGAIVQFGGQTAIKLARALTRMGVRIFGTDEKNIDAAEDREKFDMILEKTGIPRPKGKMVYTLEEALKAADELMYPVLVRPSYVLGGQSMVIAYNDNDIAEFMEIITRPKQEHPVLIDKYLMGKEIEVDAICDGENVLIPGIMEHLERAGVHSGDSISVYPPQSLSKKTRDIVVDYTFRLARALNVTGMINIQFVLYNDEVYVIEVNPRSSRTVPYISKVTGIPMVKIATKIMMGRKLDEFGYGTGLYRESEYVAVKVPVFSFEKLESVDTSLGPEMKSTGEVLGIAKSFSEALYKGIVAAGINLPGSGGAVLMTVRDSDKPGLLKIAEDFEKLGYELYATGKTAKMLNYNGIATNAVRKIGEGSPDILDLIQTKKIKLIINTPTKGRQPERDGFRIRRKAVEMSIPCLTSLDTAEAILDCIKLKTSNREIGIVELGSINN